MPNPDEKPSAATPYTDLLPRRFKFKMTVGWCGNPPDTMCFGVYFPATDCCVWATGQRSTGIPTFAGIEWVDPLDDIPWAPGKEG